MEYRITYLDMKHMLSFRLGTQIMHTKFGHFWHPSPTRATLFVWVLWDICHIFQDLLSPSHESCMTPLCDFPTSRDISPFSSHLSPSLSFPSSRLCNRNKYDDGTNLPFDGERLLVPDIPFRRKGKIHDFLNILASHPLKCCCAKCNVMSSYHQLHIMIMFSSFQDRWPCVLEVCHFPQSTHKM